MSGFLIPFGPRQAKKARKIAPIVGVVGGLGAAALAYRASNARAHQIDLTKRQLERELGFDFVDEGKVAPDPTKSAVKAGLVVGAASTATLYFLAWWAE